MKKQLLLLFMMVSAIANVHAADLLVEEFGVLPVYSSIGDAVSAASDGDRIIIRNRAGNIPWVENISINKSLTFLPFDNDTFFVVQGTYTIVPADNREVNIIGMKNTNGFIYGNAIGNTSARTVVNFLGCYLVNGGFSIGSHGYNATVAHTVLDNGTIYIRHGLVLGCDITTSSTAGGINVQSETATTNEVIKLYGNKITSNSTSTSAYGINWTSSSHFFDIRNNFIEQRNIGIYISNTRNSNLELNKLYNNTVTFVSTTSSSPYGIYCTSTSSSSVIEIMNNLVDINTTYSASHYGIYNASSSPQVNCYFNTLDGGITGARRVVGSYTVSSNNTAGTVTTDATGNNVTGSVGIDAGNPSNVFYDLDLTTNDCGAYGGSYTLANFFPIHAGSARVHLLNYPFNVRQGSTLNINAKTYDR